MDQWLARIDEARRAVRRAAAARWRERAETRAGVEADLAAGGEGAADSPQRLARFAARQAGFERARALSRAGRLPLGLERKMGPTLDHTPFAPSDAARRAGRPVARLVRMAGAGLQPEGFATGFLVGPGLLMTNHHVLPDAGEAEGVGANLLFERTERGLEAGVVFPLDPARFFVADERLDFAVVAVADRPAGGGTPGAFGAVALTEATAKILRGQPIHVIQHPGGGPKQYAVRQNRLVDILEEGFLHYETDTLEGSSGAPAFSQAWELVALHHAAIPALRDGRPLALSGEVWDEGMGEDQVRWIANEGVRVSAIVARLSALRPADPARRAILRELVAGTTDPVDELEQAGMMTGDDDLAGRSPRGTVAGRGEAASARPAGAEGGGGLHVHFSGPVTIHVHAAGTAAPARSPDPAFTPAPAGAGPDVALEAPIRFDPDYDGRPGYDPAFLDPAGTLRVPPPTAAEARAGEVLADRDGRPLVLRYHHFELAMHEERRLQLWSAANVDYDPARKSRGGRASFGRDRWIPDPRIPARLQLLDAEFYRPAGRIDRGHMVRREDNAWGDSPAEIAAANADTFHWTNCAPQHEAFNQAGTDGRGIWGALEQHIQASRRGDDTRLCLLAGPVLDPDDPAADFGLGPVRYPLRFWKIVVVAERGDGEALALRAFGFLLSQEPVVDRFGLEVFGPGRFRRYQVPLTAISETAGVVFDPVLHAADAMRGEREGIRLDGLDRMRGLPDRTSRSRTTPRT